jgi:hypothetical protein
MTPGLAEVVDIGPHAGPVGIKERRGVQKNTHPLMIFPVFDRTILSQQSFLTLREAMRRRSDPVPGADAGYQAVRPIRPARPPVLSMDYPLASPDELLPGPSRELHDVTAF